MNAILPGGSLYPHPEKWQEIEALSAGLAPDQAIWLSGYFAGLGQSLRRAHGSAAVLPAAGEALPAAPAPEPRSRTLTVLYASETGNGADLARQIVSRARDAGLTAGCADLASYRLRGLKDEQDLIIVTSTHGEGDPPEPAAGFFEFVHGRKAPSLPDTRYAVLGLGDSTYQFFCGAARKLDERLAALGAQRLQERADCDVDYDRQAGDWIGAVLGRLAGEAGAAGAAVPAAVRAPAAASEVRDHSKRCPFNAQILDRITLTGRGSSKETHHVELSLAGSGLVHEPGDALGLVPRNDPRAVESLLAAAGLDETEVIETRAGETPLGAALASEYEIGILTPRFVEHWAGLAGAAGLRALLGPERRAELAAFMRGHHVIDLVRDHPVRGLAARDFVAGLRGLQPRLYSLASSPSAAPGEAHLTVSILRYSLRGEPRTGVASGQLAARAEIGDRLPVYIQSNPHFRLPADDAAPIVMIGAGTGIAPFRAFLQEREERGAAGRSWLVLGERNFRTDFLYQTEWQDFLRNGVLSRMDVAFSRDQAERIHVQHRLREHAAELHAWLEEGAHVYVCGDAATLAPDVHRALIDVIAGRGGIGTERAEDHLRKLQRDGRYQRDVY